MGMMDKNEGEIISEQQHNEKEEEKSRGWEQWCGECWRSDRLDAVGWAAIFIWGALVLLAENTTFSANYSWWDGWSVFFAGAGVIVLLGTVIRLLIPEYKRSVVRGLILGFMLLGIGVGDQVSWFWPLVLLTIAVVILVRAFHSRR